MKNHSFRPVLTCFMLTAGMLITLPQLFAQKKTGIDSMGVVIKLHVNPNNAADTLDPKYDIVFTLVLNDTVNLKKIHLHAGSTEGSSNIFSYDLNFKNNKNLPNEITYNYAGKVVAITIAAQHLYADYYYQAKVFDSAGNSSDPLTYHFK